MFQKFRMGIIMPAAVAILFFSLTPIWAAGTAALQQLGEAFVEVAEKVTPAVVNISSTKTAKVGRLPRGFEEGPDKDFPGDEFFRRFFPFPEKPEQKGHGPAIQGTGSGFIISPDGKVVTNAHVVEDTEEITVNLADKRSFKAKVLGADKDSDIAVLKIDGKDLPIVAFGDSDKIRVGEIVLAIGNPFGLNRTVTSGIVSAKGRTNVGILRVRRFLADRRSHKPGQFRRAIGQYSRRSHWSKHCDSVQKRRISGDRVRDPFQLHEANRGTDHQGRQGPQRAAGREHPECE